MIYFSKSQKKIISGCNVIIYQYFCTTVIIRINLLFCFIKFYFFRGTRRRIPFYSLNGVTTMKKLVTPLALLFMLTACRPKEITTEDLENKAVSVKIETVQRSESTQHGKENITSFLLFPITLFLTHSICIFYLPII
jgi:hypothetical protein